MKTLLLLTRTALCAGLAAAAWAQPAAATSLALTRSFEGNINFAGTQASLQSKTGGAKACDLDGSAQAGITLPSGASIVSATLYWAGTGAIDGEVSLNGKAVSAAADRRYGSSIDGFTYFSAAADVTGLVQGKTSFSFAGLTVDTSDTYCSKKQKENSMVAGFALVVVYAHKDERYRTVNVYEGLQAVKNTSVTVKMPDYTPPADNQGAGRFGYIVWEGDRTGNQKGDEVRFAGQLLRAEPYIQKQNAFNSKSGANADENSIGIDFDTVDLAAPPAAPLDANAVFTTESDRVLLGTAIVALPSKPADLAVKKTQAGEFKLGGEITYTLAVTNLGARADGKVQVTDTLPAALTYVSAGGSDWTCAVAGQAVTCKYGKALAPGASASVQVKAKINAEGRIVNTAEVSGTGDGVPGNNSSTVEGDTGGGQPASKDRYVFTVGACQPNVVIKPSGEGCALFTGPVTAGSKPVIYVTVAENGIAKPLSTTAETSVNVRYSLECNNPAATAGTDASYAGVGLSTCVKHDTPVAAGAGAPATLKFAANEVSKRAEFHYPDVGLVTLRLRDDAGSIGKASFASVPLSLKTSFKRADGVPNPGTSALGQAGFAEAGEPFLAVVSAHGQDGIGPLKNFGRESGAFALAERLRIVAKEGELEQKLLVPQNAWSGAESVVQTFVWNEAGVANLGASLEGYLGVTSLAPEHAVVGRFYPQYFRTETGEGFGCQKRMHCPAAAPHLIARAVFSRQPFETIVHAYGRNGPLQRFEAALVPPISLVPVSAPGQDGKALGSFVNGAAAAATERRVSFQLEVAYDAKAGTRGWTPPTAVHVRATAPELRKTAAGAEAVEIRSLRDQGIASAEGGIMVVNGRLMVGNVIGTPLAKTPVPLRAQYWSGAAWEQNSGIEETEPGKGSIEYSACRRSLRLNAAMGDTCDLSVLRLEGTKSGSEEVTLPMLKEGKANLILAPVGERSGNVDLFVNGQEYLPSTFGRITFGQFKSPVIYVREMY